jgi:HSP20 family protein
VPGLESKDLDIEVSGNQLTIQGSREEKHEEDRNGEHRHERFCGSFARTVTLPSSVDPNQVKAAYDKGVLTITASKAPGQATKKVPVTT